jgi:hypothetical protein
MNTQCCNLIGCQKTVSQWQPIKLCVRIIKRFFAAGTTALCVLLLCLIDKL